MTGTDVVLVDAARATAPAVAGAVTNAPSTMPPAQALTPAPEPATAPPVRELPKTASEEPLMALIAPASLSGGLGLRILRRRTS